MSKSEAAPLVFDRDHPSSTLSSTSSSCQNQTGLEDDVDDVTLFSVPDVVEIKYLILATFVLALCSRPLGGSCVALSAWCLFAVVT